VFFNADCINVMKCFLGNPGKKFTADPSYAKTLNSDALPITKKMTLRTTTKIGRYNSAVYGHSRRRSNVFGNARF